MARGSSMLAFFFILLGISLAAAHADWIADGVQICSSAAIEDLPVVVSDGAGGAILLWRSFIASESNLYAQRIDANGNELWGSEGVLICGASGGQTPSEMMPDGAGGAIAIWNDSRNGSVDIYAQRIDASGAALWETDGVPVCTAPEMQYAPRIVSDGAGGIVTVWGDVRDGVDDRLYVQRLNAAGVPQWTENGVRLCMGENKQLGVAIASDGAGGAIVAWHDLRLNPNYDIYAQRVGASGNILWAASGVPVCTAVNVQKYPEAVPDGAGGAIVVWKDNRRGPDDLYAQRLSAAGTPVWTANGVPVCATGTVEKYHRIAPDGSGGACLVWPDTRNGTYDIYAQRMNPSGTSRWTANGVAVCTADGAQETPRIVADSQGATFIAWADARTGEYDIYAQRMSSSGVAQCAPNGFALCTAVGIQSAPALAADGLGGAIVVWEDLRNGLDYDIYANTTQSWAVLPSSIDFGSVLVGGHRDTAFAIANMGCGILAMNIGEACEHYQVISDELVPFLGPGQSIIVDIRFEPASAGTHTCEIETGAACSSVSCIGVGVEETTGDDTPRAPDATFLAQNYPNPFNPATEILFGLKEPANVSLRIYDAAGRLVRVLARGNRPAGTYRKIWDGRDANGAAVSSGIYFYRLDAGMFSETRKMVLLR